MDFQEKLSYGLEGGGVHRTWSKFISYICSLIVYICFLHYRAALTSQNHVTKYLHNAKEHGVQWQLNRSYHLTCTPGCAASCSCSVYLAL